MTPVPFVGGIRAIPSTLAQVIEVYGDPKPLYRDGVLLADPKWERKNMVPLKAGEIIGYAKRLYVHRLVAPYFVEAMRRCGDSSSYRFSSIGCFSPRHQRHDRKRPLSDHTWGIAFDVNADRNRAYTREPDGPRPFAPLWRKIADIPEPVVEAFESVGFEWGGRWGMGTRGGFCDPMHFSLRRS